MAILRVSVNSYRWPRRLIYDKLVSPDLFPQCGIIAGSFSATYEVKAYMFQGVERVASKHLKVRFSVHIDDFVDPKYALIRNIGTAEFIMRDMEAHQEILKMTNVEYISPKLDDARLEIARFIGRYKRGYDRFECVTNLEIKGFAERCYQACLDKNYFNEDIRGLYRKHEKELKNLEPLHNLVGTYIGSDNRNILTDYVLSRKLIRPCTFAVQKLRKETIFNIKETE